MKRLTALCSVLCLAVMLAAPASALEYTISAPTAPAFGKATSVDPVATADRGERANEDLSKNAALIPPPFSSLGKVVQDTPLAVGTFSGLVTWATTTATAWTEATADLYYEDGSLGTLSIPDINVNVKVVQGTSTASLAKGAGHFEDSSIWDGNVCLAGHNRGTHAIFGSIHTLAQGSRITLSTKLGSRTYAVASVSKVSETDRAGLTATQDNTLTLYTCVAGQSAYRWCVKAVEIV